MTAQGEILAKPSVMSRILDSQPGKKIFPWLSGACQFLMSSMEHCSVEHCSMEHCCLAMVV